MATTYLKVFVITLSCLVLTSTLALGARIPWPRTLYSRVSNGEELKALIRDFCSSMGIQVVIDQGVKGTVNSKCINCSPATFFKKLCRDYGLIYYFDGKVLYVYRADQTCSKLLKLGPSVASRLVSTLRALGLYDPSFPIKVQRSTGFIYVTGPPRYVDLVTQTANLLTASQKAKRATKKRQVIRIFPLKYAWASDHKFIIQDEEVTVPGVASVLKSILSQTSATTQGPTVTRLAHTLKKLKGSGLISIGRKKETKHGASDKQGPPLYPPSGKDNSNSVKAVTQEQDKGPGIDQPYIEADARLNAVIIRDEADKMDLYQQLISALDVPVHLVQIEVTIIEISTDGLAELGTQWRLRAQEKSGKDMTDAGFDATYDLLPASPLLGTGAGLNLANTLSLGAGQFLLAQIHALEEEGKAKILSRPAVLTLDNIQAVIQQTQTFYARVAGSYEVDLFNVTAGITLKVTPHIIDEKGKKKIKLLIDIKDGSISTQSTVDSLPTVPESSIHTQAVVDEGQILMLGGYVNEKKSSIRRGVPILGRLPVLKWFLSTRQDKVTRMERIFLIHPRIIGESA